MRIKICLYLLFVLLFFASCAEAEVLVFFDEKYNEFVESQHSVFSQIKKANASIGLTTSLVVVNTSGSNLDISPWLSNNMAKIIVLSPVLTTEAYRLQEFFPEHLFVLLEVNTPYNSNNIINIQKKRNSYFSDEAPNEIFEYQKLGYKMGAAFLTDTSRRISEKNSFVETLNKLNSQNYPLSLFPVSQTTNTRTATEIVSKMVQDDIDLLLLFCGSLNTYVLKELPTDNKIKVITESLFVKDKYYPERVFYSIVYDYSSSFLEMATKIDEFINNGSLSSHTISLQVKKEFHSGGFPPPIVELEIIENQETSKDEAQEETKEEGQEITKENSEEISSTIE